MGVFIYTWKDFFEPHPRAFCYRRTQGTQCNALPPKRCPRGLDLEDTFKEDPAQRSALSGLKRIHLLSLWLL